MLPPRSTRRASSSTRRHTLTPASRCVTHCWQRQCPSSKCICPTLRRGRASVPCPIFPTSPSAPSPASAPGGTNWRWKPPQAISRETDVDIRKLKKLIELVETSGVAELEITEGEDTVRIGRYPPAGSVPAAAPAVAAPPPAAPAATPEPAAGETDSKADDGRPEGHVMRAPMVGTFYRAPSPDAEPFV